MSRRSGFSVVDLVGVMVACVLLAAVFCACSRFQHDHRRTRCKTNVSNIGKALAMYQHGHGDQYPFLASSPKGWDAKPTGTNLKIDPAGDGKGEYNISAFLFLLVRDGQSPNIFICAGEDAQADANTKEGAKYHWDFNSARNISYSYQAPLNHKGSGAYGSGVSTSSESELAILADKTPTANGKDTATTDWSKMDLADSQKRDGISQNHRGEMINILRADTRVTEANSGDAGIRDDNIYSCAESTYSTYDNPPVKPEVSLAGGLSIEKHVSEMDSFLIGPK